MLDKLKTKPTAREMIENKKVEPTKLIITPPNFADADVGIIGTAPYVQNMFSVENQNKMKEKQERGSEPGKKTTRIRRPPKDFDKIYQGSMHISEQGWYGIPASGMRRAMIDVCRMTDFDMVRAKMSIFVLADGRDRASQEPLIRLVGEPRRFDSRVSIGINQTDIIARAMFDEWSATVKLRWDADIFTASDIANLLSRAGQQVGIGAGRPFSKSSTGLGFGTWKLKEG